MEIINEILLINFYNSFREKKGYKRSFKAELRNQLSNSPDGIILNFQQKKMENEFLKDIFSIVFPLTLFKTKIFLRDCLEEDANFIKLLFEAYKVEYKKNKTK